MTKTKSNSLSKATHEGVIDVNGFSIKSYNLDTGERVLSRIDFLRALGRTGKAKGGRKYDEESKIPVFLTAQNLKPFITSELIRDSFPIQFIDLNGIESIGYKAEILPATCYVFIDALDSGNLKQSQAHIAEKAKLLVRGFATVGIIALVDEATGYQHDRERDELQKILSQYISKELLPWQKRFPDEFYMEIFRLKGWDYTVKGITQRPGWIGGWTKSNVYGKLPDGVIRELYKNTPKTSSGKLKKKLHQSLTLDIGNPHLEKLLISIITLMNVSKDWKEFTKLYNKKFGQQELEFPEPEIIKEPSQPKTDFDKQLKGLLSVPKPND